jgi:hypothetical protein
MRLTRGRVTQLLDLTLLAPHIHGELLAGVAGREAIAERAWSERTQSAEADEYTNDTVQQARERAEGARPWLPMAYQSRTVSVERAVEGESCRDGGPRPALSGRGQGEG